MGVARDVAGKINMGRIDPNTAQILHAADVPSQVSAHHLPTLPFCLHSLSNLLLPCNLFVKETGFCPVESPTLCGLLIHSPMFLHVSRCLLCVLCFAQLEAEAFSNCRRLFTSPQIRSSVPVGIFFGKSPSQVVPSGGVNCLLVSRLWC